MVLPLLNIKRAVQEVLDGTCNTHASKTIKSLLENA
jgi:hypothetical protein